MTVLIVDPNFYPLHFQIKKKATTAASLNMKQATLSFGTGKKLTISKSAAPKCTDPLHEILSAPSSSKISKPKKMKKYEQLVMDCGQKSFTSNRCKSCGMVYMNGDFQDEKVHNKFCQSFKKLMKYKVTSKVCFYNDLNSIDLY